eukprot:COSAG06_NODE_15819_length_1042_cov_1.475080_1_plen_24_part_01
MKVEMKRYRLFAHRTCSRRVSHRP